jgi:hypothetical protein
MNEQILKEIAESKYGTDMGSIRGGNVYDLNADLKKGFVDGAKYAVENNAIWIKTEYKTPEFDTLVLVYCKTYGRFLATYEFIGEFAGEKYGNWRDMHGNLGILPPVYWMSLPESPLV